MGVTFLIALCLVTEVTSVRIETRYHEVVGIPLAEKIRVSEENRLESRDWLKNRIVGGGLTPLNAYPYFAGLLISFENITGQSVCGAALISASRVVTAASCWRDSTLQASQFLVILGTNLLFSGGTRILTNDVVEHPEYNPANFHNNVAVIYLPYRVVYTDSIHRLHITEEIYHIWFGQRANITGFGRTSDQHTSISPVLRYANMTVGTAAQCRDVYGPEYITYDNLCSNGKDGAGICAGDVGGPLVGSIHGRPGLVGISSFFAASGCELGFPSVFSHAVVFRPFITQHCEDFWCT